jgi:hypothetical protein
MLLVVMVAVCGTCSEDQEHAEPLINSVLQLLLQVGVAPVGVEVPCHLPMFKLHFCCMHSSAVSRAALVAAAGWCDSCGCQLAAPLPHVHVIVPHLLFITRRHCVTHVFCNSVLSLLLQVGVTRAGVEVLRHLSMCKQHFCCMHSNAGFRATVATVSCAAHVTAAGRRDACRCGGAAPSPHVQAAFYLTARHAVSRATAATAAGGRGACWSGGAAPLPHVRVIVSHVSFCFCPHCVTYACCTSFMSLLQVGVTPVGLAVLQHLSMGKLRADVCLTCRCCHRCRLRDACWCGGAAPSLVCKWHFYCMHINAVSRAALAAATGWRDTCGCGGAAPSPHVQRHFCHVPLYLDTAADWCDACWLEVPYLLLCACGSSQVPCIM